MTIKRKLLSFVSLAVITLAIGGVSYAQNNDIANGFRISPVLQEYTIEPGNSQDTYIEVTNPSDGTVKAKVVANDFGPATDESGTPAIILDDNTPVSGNSFKSLVGGFEDFELGPKEKIKIPFTISVPENASPGGYYGAVRAEALPGEGGQVTVTASVGTLFLVTVPGNINEMLELVDFSAAKNESTGRFFFGNGDGLQLVTRLKNSGNIHLKPNGKVNIKDSKGNEVVSYEFNSENGGGNVLPNSTRKYVDNINKDKLFGKYTATAYLGYGTGKGLITADATFWVIPYWLVAVVIAGILAIIAIAFLVYRKVSKSRKHKVKPRR